MINVNQWWARRKGLRLLAPILFRLIERRFPLNAKTTLSLAKTLPVLREVVNHTLCWMLCETNDQYTFDQITHLIEELEESYPFWELPPENKSSS